MNMENSDNFFDDDEDGVFPPELNEDVEGFELPDSESGSDGDDDVIPWPEPGNERENRGVLRGVAQTGTGRIRRRGRGRYIRAGVRAQGANEGRGGNRGRGANRLGRTNQGGRANRIGRANQGERANQEGGNEELRNPAERVDYVGVDGTIWAVDPPGQNFTPNTVDLPPGPTNLVPEGASISEIFQLFFTDEVLEFILRHSNAYGEHVIANYNLRRNEEKVWKAITRDELLAFMGLLLWTGVQHDYKTPVDELWSTNPLHTKPIYACAMGRDRFKQIIRAIRFDDAVERHRGGNFPRARPISEFLEMIKPSFARMYVPGKHLTVDESLSKFRGGAPFRVYMPSKPGKYGLKFWTCVDSSSSYILTFQLYEGAQAQREVNQGQRVTLDLVEPYFGSWRIITTDNFFSSASLARRLYQNQLLLIGTMRRSKREVPLEFRAKRGRVEFSTLFGFNNEVTLSSYKPEARKDTVVSISTAHHTTDVSEEPHRKPLPIMDYNRTKGGVDSSNQMASMYTCQRPVRRWPLKAMWFVMDITALNSYVIFKERNPNWRPQDKSKRRKAIETLAIELMLPEIRKRAQDPTKPKHVKESLSKFSSSTGIELPHPPIIVPEAEVQRGKCTSCLPPRKLSRTRCGRCNHFACAQHQITYCRQCSENIPPRE